MKIPRIDWLINFMFLYNIVFVKASFNNFVTKKDDRTINIIDEQLELILKEVEELKNIIQAGRYGDLKVDIDIIGDSQKSRNICINIHDARPIWNDNICNPTLNDGYLATFYKKMARLPIKNNNGDSIENIIAGIALDTSGQILQNSKSNLIVNNNIESQSQFEIYTNGSTTEKVDINGQPESEKPVQQNLIPLRIRNQFKMNKKTLKTLDDLLYKYIIEETCKKIQEFWNSANNQEILNFIKNIVEKELQPAIVDAIEMFS